MSEQQTETPNEKRRRELRGVALSHLQHLANCAMRCYAGDRASEEDINDAHKAVLLQVEAFEGEANALSQRLTAVEEENRQVKEERDASRFRERASRRVRNEAAGLLGAWWNDLVATVGITNVRCLERAIAEFDAVATDGGVASSGSPTQPTENERHDQPVVLPETAPGAEPLTFAALIQANLSRVVRWHPAGLSDWSPLEWAGAMGGEAGEASNAAKKLKRVETQLANHDARLFGQDLSLPEQAAIHRKHIAKEVADTIIYGALLVSAVGEDLEAAIVEVFNKKSEEYGFPERLPLPPSPGVPSTERT